MRSIRNSLIVYFVGLLTFALGAVSWSSYRMTEQSLREQQKESRIRIAAQCETNCSDARADLDRRLLEQANAMANLSRSSFIHAEGHFALMGMVGTGAMPLGHLNVGAFWNQGVGNAELASEFFRLQPLTTFVQDADGLVADRDRDRGQEYFQLYRNNGVPMQRSASLGNQEFTLGRNLRRSLALHTEHFDDLELAGGVKARRVTIKANVNTSGVTFVRWPNGLPVPQYANFFKGPTWRAPQWPPNANGKKGNKGGFAQQPRRFQAKTPWFFIQYASDTAPTEAKIFDFQSARDNQLEAVDQTIEDNLQQLRSRFFWICLITIGAVWVGGYGVIRLGLAPLSKMSDAVSQVSAKNFHLQLDAKKLPDELRPIADRLEHSLCELQKAFAREKQAAADISHELRTPLAALMTTLEVALRKARSTDEYREILEECRGSGQHMYHLVERLLTLARLDAGADAHRPREVDVIDVAMNCADLIRPLARARGLDLRLHLPDPINTVTDPDKLREVLVNLLHNAVEYNKPNGAIDLGVERVNGHIRLEVRDTGIGIKPETLEHIFERFYRADPSRHADTPHAGLGLAIVKSYVDLLGGTIRVESSDVGTAFIIEFPFIAPQPDLATAVEPELAFVKG